jgi:hypothetical protein
MTRLVSVALTLLAFVLFFAPGNLRAQIAEGSIGGVVTDPSGAAVAGSPVIATNVETGVVSKTTTTSIGYYQFPELPFGTYTVAVEQQGFQRAVTAPLVLHSGDKLRVDIALAMGTTTQSIQVTAAAPLVNATTTELGTVFAAHEISELPFNGRTFTEILSLQPGWNVGTVAAQTGGVSMNGLSGLGNNWLVDGVDMSMGESNGVGIAAEWGGQFLITNVSMDAIAELKATSGAATAEYDRASGGTINLTTKSGTDHFHGTAFEYLRNDAVDANTFFNNMYSVAKAPLRQNQFGGNLGGPILHDKLFFFANYEGVRKTTGAPVSGTVPTPLMYSEMKNPDLVTWFERWVPPMTAPTSDPLVGLYYHSTSLRDNEDMGLARVDGNFGKNRLSFRMMYGNQLVAGPNWWFLTPNMEADIPLYSRNYLGSWTLMFTPTAVNTLRVGSNSALNYRESRGIGPLSADNRTLPGVPGPQGFDPQYPGIGVISTYGYIFPMDQVAVNSPTKTVADDFTWVHGAHTVQTGLNFRHTHSIRDQFGSGVFYYYDTEQDMINDHSDFFQLDIGNPGKNCICFWSYGGYVQDNWKVNRRLTVNYGLHYDYFQAMNGPIGLATNNPLGPTTALGSPLYKSPKDDFSPRVGVVYSLTADGKTVLRLGYGTYFGAPQPYYYFSGPWIAANVPTFPTVARVDMPSNLNLSFPNINWNFVQGIRDNPSTVPPGLAGGFTAPTPDNHKDEYSEQYNATLERQLTPTLVASVAYVGNRTLHLTDGLTYNLIDPATGVRGVGASIGPIQLLGTGARMWYNALNVRVRKTTSHGIAFDAFYTWSKNMVYDGGDEAGGGQISQDPHNIEASIGPADHQISNEFTGDFVWAIPTGRVTANSALARGILGGWSLTGIFTAFSGQSIGVGTGLDQVGYGIASGRPDVVPGVSPYEHTANRLQFLNPAAFDTATPVAQERFGNAGYDSLYGPGGFGFDAGIHKSWKIYENQELTFRFEMFNALNHEDFNVPWGSTNLSTTSGAFGLLQSGTPGRELQFALRYSF